MVVTTIVMTNDSLSSVKLHVLSAMTDDIEVVAGTYEEFLVGYKIKNQDDSIEMSHSFATHAHTGSIKCITATDRYLASGGSDDKIIIHDMKTRTENKVLLHHDGTVNTVAFTSDGTHLFSGGSDGCLYAVRTGNWVIEKRWPKAHKGSAITHIAIHPTNKLALTLGDDHTLRTWNLIKGRQAYATNLKSKGIVNCLSIVWNPDGSKFALTGSNNISIWSISNASIEKTLNCESKCNCISWISETRIVAGLENGQISIFDLESDERNSIQGHTRRIKDVAFKSKYLYTAASSGDVKVWKYKKNKMTLSEKAMVNTDCRLTCLVLVTRQSEVKSEDINMETILADDTNENENDESEIKIDERLVARVTVTDENIPRPKTDKNKLKNKRGINKKFMMKRNKKFRNKK